MDVRWISDLRPLERTGDGSQAIEPAVTSSGTQADHSGWVEL